MYSVRNLSFSSDIQSDFIYFDPFKDAIPYDH